MNAKNFVQNRGNADMLHESAGENWDNLDDSNLFNTLNYICILAPVKKYYVIQLTSSA